MSELFIKSEYISLSQALKLCGAVLSGGQAKELISEGEVKVNGETCLQRGRKLRPGDVFEASGEVFEVRGCT
ncbi:MAG: RNA-binding S4 domain-containing protein [Oscillospiraceae bacterium]|nr:RNA-binding S4 domain-containing protein [Oscillospiraceae bacterium]